MVHPTMQAVQVFEFGGPEQLKLEPIPRPEPQAGQVLLRVQAAGVLPADCKTRQGLFQRFAPVSLPYIPGSAVAGVVEEVGPGVTSFQKGQAVFGKTSGGACAEYTAAAVDTLAWKPDGLGFAEAATISGSATIAWSALFENAALQAGQRVLIHAAAGGVGLFAVQIARWKGAHVIGTASAANAEFVKALGAETVIDYAATPFEQAVKDVDVVLDTVGGDTLRRSMQVIRPGGILVSLLEEPSQAQAQQYGIRAMKNAPVLPFPSMSLLEAIARLMADGAIKTAIAREFPLQEVREAHILCQSGHGRGRIILRIGDYPSTTEK